jgi:hypothetical protein
MAQTHLLGLLLLTLGKQLLKPGLLPFKPRNSLLSLGDRACSRGREPLSPPPSPLLLPPFLLLRILRVIAPRPIQFVIIPAPAPTPTLRRAALAAPAIPTIPFRLHLGPTSVGGPPPA